MGEFLPYIIPLQEYITLTVVFTYLFLFPRQHPHHRSCVYRCAEWDNSQLNGAQDTDRRMNEHRLQSWWIVLSWKHKKKCLLWHKTHIKALRKYELICFHYIFMGVGIKCIVLWHRILNQAYLLTHHALGHVPR